jgi:hypothetical protein
MSAPHHVSGTGILGSILAIWSYIELYMPDAGHLVAAVITAACCGVAGYISTELAKWCWRKLGLAYTEVTLKISSRKKGLWRFNKRK